MNRRGLLGVLAALTGWVRTVRAHDLDAALSLAPIDLPEVPLIDQHGREWLLRSRIAAGHRFVLTLQFTSCAAQCPVAAAVLAALDARLDGERDGDVRLISLTLDAVSDTPEVLAARAAEMGASPRWLWLTGAKAALDQVYRAVGASRGPKEEHDAWFLVGQGPSGQFIRLPGHSSPDALVKALDRFRG